MKLCMEVILVRDGVKKWRSTLLEGFWTNKKYFKEMLLARKKLERKNFIVKIL